MKSEMLIMFDTKLNCNKFYEVILNNNNDVVIRYGRVGAKGQTKNYFGEGERKFNSLIRSKEKKGYKKIEVDSGLKIENHSNKNIMEKALEQIKYKDERSKILIEYMVKANIHSITKNTNISYDEKSGVFKTPIGVVGKDSVIKAELILNNIEDIINNKNIDNNVIEQELFKLNEDYFVLIPNKIKNARDKKFLLFDIESVNAQRSICQSLLETIDLLKELKEKPVKVLDKKEEIEEKLFDIEIEHIKDKNTFEKICKLYEETKNDSHGRTIKNSVVNNVFKIKMNKQVENFERKSQEIGNVKQLWHGTRMSNVLSIFSRGLLMPKQSPSSKAGAMFGYGLYFADQSSKSLQYCDGLYYGSNSKRSNRIYMFLTSVALGKQYTPSNPTQSNPPKGFDSYFAKSGVSGVRNNEFIVFDCDQVRFDYLIEIKI